MKLIICSKRVYETSPGTYKSVRFPIGELRRNEETGIWLMMLYLDPSVEYLVVEQSDENEPSRNRRFSVFSLMPINDEGIDDVRQYKIGKTWVTNNGGGFMNMNLLPSINYQVLDPHKVLSS